MTRLYIVSACIITLLVILAGCSLQRAGEQTSNVMAAVSQQSAAVGYGAATKGGTGGTVITLATTSEAALKAALTRNEPRTILLTGSGIIDLTADIKITTPFLTIDGSGAPALQIRGGTLIVKTHDVIIRHLRIRPGDSSQPGAVPSSSSPDDRDAICLCGGGGSDVYNVYLEHNSLMWGPDMGALAMLDNVHDVTVIGNILGPGLYLSRHSEAVAGEGHSMSTSMFRLASGGPVPRNITLVQNLFTSADRRMPVVYGSNIEIVNNVVYNWKRRPSGGNPSQLNFINNVVKPGPETPASGRVAWSPQLHSQSPAYFSQAVYESGTEGITARGAPSSVYRTTPWPMTIDAPVTAASAYDAVLNGSGAQPRDSIDARIIQDVRDGTGRFPNAADLSWETAPGPTPTTPTVVPVPTLTVAPTASPVPIVTPTPVVWTTITCPVGTLITEQLSPASMRWRCGP